MTLAALDWTLECYLEGRAERADVERVAETLVAFYAGLAAEKVPPETVITRYEQELAGNAAVVCDPKFGLDVVRAAAAQKRAEAVFDEARPILRQRISEGRFVEGNGDLRPEHIFLTEPLAIIDCLEFSKPLRTIDPFEEITCLGLEAAQLGADWVFPVLRDVTAEGLANRPPAVLLSFYWRYRALLRARFALLHLTHPVVRTAWKWRPLAQHYIALSEQAKDMVRLQLQEDQ